jgi:hypothetical protein
MKREEHLRMKWNGMMWIGFNRLSQSSFHEQAYLTSLGKEL